MAIYHEKSQKVPEKKSIWKYAYYKIDYLKSYLISEEEKLFKACLKFILTKVNRGFCSEQETFVAVW